jgi:RNA polymerase sigma factor (sigma-70 family)
VTPGDDNGAPPWSAAAMAARRAQHQDDGPGPGDGDDSGSIGTWVRLARAGDRAALGRIVERCDPMVRSVARRHLSDPADVEDVVQEVWVALVEHVGAIRVPEATRGWLVRVTTREAWRVRRVQGRAAPTPDLGAAEPADDDTEERGLRGARRGDLSRSLGTALDALRPGDRRLLTLLAADDRPDYRAIGATIGRPVGSIGPTRQRALARLRLQPALAGWRDAG